MSHLNRRRRAHQVDATLDHPPPADPAADIVTPEKLLSKEIKLDKETGLYLCILCSRGFKKPEGLKRHYRAKHP